MTRFVAWRGSLKTTLAKLLARLYDPSVGEWRHKVVMGHYRYHAVPGDLARLRVFGQRLRRLWRLAVSRRSQRGGRRRPCPNHTFLAEDRRTARFRFVRHLRLIYRCFSIHVDCFRYADISGVIPKESLERQSLNHFCADFSGNVGPVQNHLSGLA